MHSSAWPFVCVSVSRCVRKPKTFGPYLNPEFLAETHEIWHEAIIPWGHAPGKISFHCVTWFGFWSEFSQIFEKIGGQPSLLLFWKSTYSYTYTKLYLYYAEFYEDSKFIIHFPLALTVRQLLRNFVAMECKNHQKITIFKVIRVVTICAQKIDWVK